MSKQLSKITPLQINKTVVLLSPLEDNDVLVRTGTIQEDNLSLFHSVFSACYSQYLSYNLEDRKKYLRKTCSGIVKNIDIKLWKKMGGGSIAIKSFQDNTIKIINNMYNFIIENKDPEKITKKILKNNKKYVDIYALVVEIIPLQYFQEHILTAIFNKSKNINEYIEQIPLQTISYLKQTEVFKSIDSKRAEYICDMTYTFLKNVLTEIEEYTHKEYIKNVEDISKFTDIDNIELLSSFFQCDIYIINDKNRLPCKKFCDKKNIKGRKSIILLLIDKNNYEIMGKLINGKKVQREFSHQDQLIQKIYTYLLEPEKLPSKYPKLLCYLEDENDDKDSDFDNSSISDE